MRNAYTLLDYGDFIEDAFSDRGDPFVQLLPLTDPSEAHSDFVKVRLGGVDTTGDSAHQLLPESEAQSSPESKAEKEQHIKGEILRNWPYIFLGALVIFLASVGLIVWKCCCKRRGGQAKPRTNSILPLSSKREKYQSLDNSAPHMPMQTIAQQQSSYYVGDR